MTDKEFWEMVRRALLMIVRAIEKKYQLGGGKITVIEDTDTVSYTT
jgi:hypothetical protein